MVLTTAIQMDAVAEFYYHNGVVSEILGTVRLVRCWLLSPPARKISSVNTLSVVVSEMFKRSRPRMVKDWPPEQPLAVAETIVL